MLYEILFRQIPMPVALVDGQLIVQDASDAYTVAVRSDREQLIGSSLDQIFSLGDHADAARRAIRAGAAFEVESNPAVTGRPMLVRVEPVVDMDDRGAIVVLTAAAADAADDRIGRLHAEIRSVKHEINNPLTGALGNINLLLRRADLDEKTRKRLATAEQELKKIGLLVLRLSDLAPSSQAKSTPS